MSKLLRALLAIIPLLAATLFLAVHPASAASLTEVTNFGSNPSNLRMYVYVPNNVAARPAILVAVHYCTGSGPAFFSGTEFASLADQYGFIVIYPSATRSGSCFDVSSPQALRHDGGSDPVGIVSMVKYVEQHNNGDSSRVYVTGASSGGMMTNVLLGDYPDVFKAGAAFMGVPFGCFATTDGSLWNNTCANGNSIKTPQQWGDLVRAAFPGYSGPRPRMQLWHGTADTTLRYPNFGEEIKQWTNVFSLSQTPTFTDHPQTSWTRTRYGGSGTNVAVEAISVQGAGHTLPMSGMAALAIQFFGLTGGPTPTATGTNTQTPGTPTATPTRTNIPTPTRTPASTPTTAASCQVSYTIVNQWNPGFQASIDIKNTGSTPINGWTLAWSFANGQTISQLWNAIYTQSGANVSATNLSWNAGIASGASVNIGFNGSWSGSNTKPTAFQLNGSSCAVAA
jgi:poly(hydroxyalkanoate) depolymerase family esterase